MGRLQVGGGHAGDPVLKGRSGLSLESQSSFPVSQLRLWVAAPCLCTIKLSFEAVNNFQEKDGMASDFQSLGMEGKKNQEINI